MTTTNKKQVRVRKRPTTRAERAEHEVKTTDIVSVSGNGGGLVQKGVQGFLTTYTDEIGEAIVLTVRGGMPLTFAAHLHKVPHPTVEGWLAKGEENPDSTWGEFAANVRQAQAEFVEEAIEGIKRAGLDDARQWTALMTLLERIYPEYFKRPDSGHSTNVNVNVAVGLVERRLHELHENGEIVYDGG